MTDTHTHTRARTRTHARTHTHTHTQTHTAYDLEKGPVDDHEVADDVDGEGVVQGPVVPDLGDGGDLRRAPAFAPCRTCGPRGESARGPGPNGGFGAQSRALWSLSSLVPFVPRMPNETSGPRGESARSPGRRGAKRIFNSLNAGRAAGPPPSAPTSHRPPHGRECARPSACGVRRGAGAERSAARCY